MRTHYYCASKCGKVMRGSNLFKRAAWPIRHVSYIDPLQISAGYIKISSLDLTLVPDIRSREKGVRRRKRRTENAIWDPECADSSVFWPAICIAVSSTKLMEPQLDRYWEKPLLLYMESFVFLASPPELSSKVPRSWYFRIHWSKNPPGWYGPVPFVPIVLFLENLHLLRAVPQHLALRNLYNILDPTTAWDLAHHFSSLPLALDDDENSTRIIMSSSRAVHHFVSPEKEVNAGIWSLFGGATVCLVLRLWCKLRRQGLWWDDYILILSWVNTLFWDIKSRTSFS